MKPPSHAYRRPYTAQPYAYASPYWSRGASRFASSPRMLIGASVSPNAASRYHRPSLGSWNRYGSSAPPTPPSPHVNGTSSGTKGPVGDDDIARPMHWLFHGCGAFGRLAAKNAM